MVFQGREKQVQSIKVPGRKGQMDFLGRSNEKRSRGEDGKKQALGAESHRGQEEIWKTKRILSVKINNFLLAYSHFCI